MAAGNKSETGISRTGRITTNMIIVGIKITKVQAAQMKPAERIVTYHELIIFLPDIIPKIVNDETNIPVTAATIV